MSFEPRVVHQADGASTPNHPASAPLPPTDTDQVDQREMDACDGQAEMELPQELQLLGKKLGRESVKLSGFYPAVADDDAFLAKLSAAHAAGGPRYWFQKLWFRSTAAIVLVAAGIAVLTSPGLDSPAERAADAVANPVGSVPQVSTVRASEFQIPEVRLLRGLSGEEIEGLREFEKPGTRISL